MVIISYHSLQTVVKVTDYIKGYDENGNEFAAKKGIVNVLTKKPEVADDQEIKVNHSSRSAKMRAAEKAYKK